MKLSIYHFEITIHLEIREKDSVLFPFFWDVNYSLRLHPIYILGAILSGGYLTDNSPDEELAIVLPPESTKHLDWIFAAYDRSEKLENDWFFDSQTDASESDEPYLDDIPF